ncbi:MAG: hypothetical protein ACK500_08485 [Flavobacteriales bacterium]|jgi:hypothetical protein
MKYLFIFATLTLSFLSCSDNDGEANLVVDYLDMTSNDYSVQTSYRSMVELFQNNSYPIDINQPAGCVGNFLQRRVLPKNGVLQITKSQIHYTPNLNFHGIDSIQYELCCNNKCNVFLTKFVIWKDNEGRCEDIFTSQSSNFYYGYSIGDIATSTFIKVGLLPPINCGQFIESITVNKNPKFGSATIKSGQEISFEGDLPKKTSDTILYTLKIRIGEKTQSKPSKWVIERLN